jgi:menaquinol-cytochrome c reductase iron-sulfur subunit
MSKSTEPTEVTRRKFLGIFVGAAAGAVAVAMAVPLIRYFLSPVFAKAPAKTTIAIASTSEIPVGTPQFYTYQETVQDGWVTAPETMGVWVVTTDGKNFVLFNPHCTHLGCLYAWNPGLHEFQCPCHGSVFDINGKVLAGPAPRPLDRMPFTIVNGTIELITT